MQVYTIDWSNWSQKSVWDKSFSVLFFFQEHFIDILQIFLSIRTLPFYQITPCTRDGINKVTLTGCDARVFCLGVRLVKRRTVQQVVKFDQHYALCRFSCKNLFYLLFFSIQLKSYFVNQSIIISLRAHQSDVKDIYNV